jgi:hypothetical protein
MLPLFSISYFPSQPYMEECMNAGEIIIESHEHFVKQTFRNRTYIAGPNGRQALIIPVNHTDLSVKPIRDVKISNDTRWQDQHWRSIIAAYRNSPFFEYYEDQFIIFYEKQFTFLFDFNVKLLEKLFSISKNQIKISFTEKFEKYPDNYKDLRNVFHPKKESENHLTYHQVFGDTNGFIRDCGVIDLLCNTGRMNNEK